MRKLGEKSKIKNKETEVKQEYYFMNETPNLNTTCNNPDKCAHKFDELAGSGPQPKIAVYTGNLYNCPLNKTLPNPMHKNEFQVHKQTCDHCKKLKQ